jgi:hypothetical protein
LRRLEFLNGLMKDKGVVNTSTPLLPFKGADRVRHPGVNQNEEFHHCKLYICMSKNNCNSCSQVVWCTKLYDALC